jgi:CheY-like chemotaxis protein
MREKILVVDREPDIRKILKTILRKEGYQVRSAKGGDEALDIFKSEPFDLVIMDINMPVTSGLEVLREMKRLDEDIKLIVLTGSVSIGNAVQALRHNGAFDFLTKPLENREQLITGVKQALEKSGPNREKKASIRKPGSHQPAGKKILIVDDDPQLLDMLNEMLSAHKYETETASSGFEAGTKVVKFKPGLIILDLIMPEMSGFEVCRRIKEDPDTSHIKILAITGYDTEENRNQIMEAGADGYIPKPLKMDILIRYVEDLLGATVVSS